MKFWKVALAAVLLAGLVVVPIGCSDSEDEEDFPGTWNLYYQWAGTGMGSTTMYIASDGSFTTLDGGRGTWDADGKQITIRFVIGGAAIYSGRLVNDRRVEGTMSDPAGGLPGTFWMDKI